MTETSHAINMQLYYLYFFRNLITLCVCVQCVGSRSIIYVGYMFNSKIPWYPKLLFQRENALPLSEYRWSW
jgi:hypothetical protein